MSFYVARQSMQHLLWIVDTYSNKSSAAAKIVDRLATIDLNRKLEGCAPVLGERWITMYHNVVWVEAYLRTKSHLDPSSRLATINMSRKVAGLCPFLGARKLGSHLTQCGLGRGLSPWPVASWLIQTFGHHRHGPNIRGSVPFWGEGGWVRIYQSVA